MALLGRAEVLEEVSHLLVVGDTEQAGEALATPRLDQGADEQAVGLAPGLVAGAQVGAVAGESTEKFCDRSRTRTREKS